jgi:hypothetical protein
MVSFLSVITFNKEELQSFGLPFLSEDLVKNYQDFIIEDYTLRDGKLSCFSMYTLIPLFLSAGSTSNLNCQKLLHWQ